MFLCGSKLFVSFRSEMIYLPDYHLDLNPRAYDIAAQARSEKTHRCKINLLSVKIAADLVLSR